MRLRDIKLAACKHLSGGDIVILEGPAASFEHRLVAQYEEVVKSVDYLDAEAFERGGLFLQELASIAGDNATWKCLSVINRTAFDKPTEENVSFLMKHAAEQAKYGLNVNMTIVDGWECAGKSDAEIVALKDTILSPLVVTHADITDLKQRFKRAGLPQEKIAQQVGNFLAACEARHITVPKLG